MYVSWADTPAEVLSTLCPDVAACVSACMSVFTSARTSIYTENTESMITTKQDIQYSQMCSFNRAKKFEKPPKVFLYTFCDRQLFV